MSDGKICDYVALANPGVRRLSPYQAGKPIEELQRELGLTDIIKLASNENPLGASPKVIATATKELSQMSLYPDSRCYYLVDALAEFHQVSPDRITIGNGSDHLFGMLTQAFVKPEEEVIISEYAFATFAIVIHLQQGVPVVVPAKSWQHDLSAMAKAISSRTRLIFIANPNNPTATCFNETEFQNFMQQIPSDVIVVIDEAYYEYAKNPEYPNTIAMQKTFPNLITTRTFSKAYGLAGLRLGYSISPEDCAECLNRVRLPFAINRIAQVAGVAALQDQDHIEKSTQENRAGYQQLSQEFTDLGLTFLPSVCNFISVNMGENALSVYESLLKLGIIVRPLVPYNMATFLRITIGRESQNNRLISALKSILKGKNK